MASAKKSTPLWIAPGFVEGEKVSSPQLVSFEVAVTTSKEGGGSIDIWSVAEVGAKGSSEHMNKISFDVPVYFQAPKNKEDEA